MSEVYKVLRTKKNSGLTVGSFSLPAGKTFVKEQWKFGDKALAYAIESGRCEKVEPETYKKDQKKADKKEKVNAETSKKDQSGGN